MDKHLIRPVRTYKNMINMSNFNISRTMRLVKWSFVEERGYAIRTTIIITLLMTLFMTMMSIGSEPIFMANASNPETQRAVLLKMSRSFSFVCHGTYWFIILVGGSMMFRNMKTKQQRIAYMMLPASNVEKFVSRLVLVVLGGILMAVASFLVSDLLQQLFMRYVYGQSHIGSYAVILVTTLSDIASRGVRAFDELGPTFSSYVTQAGLRDIFAGTSVNPGPFIVFYYCLGDLFDLSVFIFIGTLFRRHGWLFACVIYSLLKALIYLILPESDFWLSLSVMLAGMVVLTWLSFRLFTRMQVINNKLLNI